MVDTLEKLAGTMPDRLVAERLGIGVAAVKAWRRDHGVAPYLKAPPTSEKQVTEAAVDEAPSAPGRRLVRRRGNSGTIEVVATRTAPPAVTAEAPAPNGGRSATARLDAVRVDMGSVSDDVIAQRAGVSRALVGAYRRKHGIGAYKGYLFEAGHAPLTGGRASHKEKQASARTEEAKRGRTSRIDAFASLVGVESDASVAAKAGVTRAAVTAWRRRHGITASQAPQTVLRIKHTDGPRKAKPAVDTKLDSFRDRMGNVSDSDVAAVAGVATGAVVRYRRKHGIPGWQGFRSLPRRRRQGSAVASERSMPSGAVPEPAGGTTRPLQAYTVVASVNGVQRDFIAVGPNLASACARAQEVLETRADGPWRVEGIKLLGDAVA